MGTLHELLNITAHHHSLGLTLLLLHHSGAEWEAAILPTLESQESKAVSSSPWVQWQALYLLSGLHH